MKLEKFKLLPKRRKSILIIEDVHSSISTLTKRLLHLKKAGYFNSLSAVLVGYFHDCDQKNKQENIHSMILDILAEYDFPIVVLKNLGHSCDNLILPVGANIIIDSGAHIRINR